MQLLSDRLSRELVSRGNLPISAEGIVRLRPDIAHEFSAAELLLADEIERGPWEIESREAGDSRTDVLEAQFFAVADGVEQCHLFVMEGPESDSNGTGIRRWSKTPVSYGSFVQLHKFLSETWGEIRGLEVQLSRVRLNQ